MEKAKFSNVECTVDSLSSAFTSKKRGKVRIVHCTIYDDEEELVVDGTVRESRIDNLSYYRKDCPAECEIMEVEDGFIVTKLFIYRQQ